ncbi:NmrA family NAD(P)-binding protein [Spirosoma pollinicola]|uniref:NmrA family protein n=1 Tax=Spirosoma pollinicola TaxID=2057025 RepID=A0A2K8Z3J8_9BACT|nr:NmrA family NAD(P)-binding protein [Spirosoma pollinicola]AUD04443.1 NmrA family protein [Spirosoma pollinicola]
MSTTIVVAGGTGDLGGRIIHALRSKGANVRALVRASTDSAKLDTLKQQGVDVIQVDMTDIAELTQACTGASCVVSALQGLRDVIVDAQSSLLDAAVAAGVPHFVPSDFSSDFTKLTPGDNRNFDLRREFNTYLDTQKTIAGTSILNGAFAELLTYNIPFLDFKKKSVGYWESADWRVDFTTMDNTAAFTAAAAMDPSAPRILRIASFQINANELKAVAEETMKEPFTLVRLGSRDDLAAYNKRERAAHPEGEQEVYPNWQRSQYIQSMFSVQNEPLDNGRYPDIQWTSVQEVLAKRR